MTIKAGDTFPSGTLYEMTAEGPSGVSTDDVFANKTVVLFALPGAFTPTCSAQHLPGYVALADQIKAKSVDEIICFAVNDVFVMGAWGKSQNVGDKVRMMADGSGLITQQLGLELDLIEAGLGTRCQRFAMVVENGTVKSIDVEAPGEFEISSAAHQLSRL